MDIADEDERTLWCGNLSDNVTEEILYELFLQGGPVQKVIIPKDRDGKQRTYGFVTYKYANSVMYALRLFDGTMLFNRRISMQRRNNLESPQTEPFPENPFSFTNALQLGHQMYFGNNTPQSMLLSSNPLANINTYHTKIDLQVQDDRASRRMHPYQKDATSRHGGSRYDDHRSRTSHDRNNHYKDNYSRHNYKSSRRNYR